VQGTKYVYCAMGRKFDARTVQICVHEHVCLYWVWVFSIIIIISLMSPLLGHKPSLWITHKRAITHHASLVRVDELANKYSRNQRLNVPPEARRS
jgi:hypothetical protein